jgi:mannose-6-phosphate isomerase class I
LSSYTTFLPIVQIFSSLTSFLNNHPFTWTLIPIALLIAAVLSFHRTFLLAFSICSYCSVLKMETSGCSDMVVRAYECTPCYNTGDHNVHTYCYGNLNSHNI